jgi:hypothetical protein
MTRKKLDEESVSVTARFPKILVEKIDHFIKKFKKENQGLTISRADTIRMILTQYFEHQTVTE